VIQASFRFLEVPLLQKYLYTEKFKIGKLRMELVLMRELLRCQIEADGIAPPAGLSTKRRRGNLRRAGKRGFPYFLPF
jgi:hypothetical protein